MIMDLSKSEYPEMLASIEPSQAIAILNQRLNLIGSLNNDVADWLQEKCRIEEAYAQSLRRLTTRQFAQDKQDLGIFSTALTKIASSAESTAAAHSSLAQNIRLDVEQPLRKFAGSNREMQAMSTIVGNLQSLAKDLDLASKKADKLKDKGGRAGVGKVANAATEVELAQDQWESQAPYVFERLQEVDEMRCNHLRDVLTQYQTHVIESSSAMSSAAEDCLNTLLNIQSADEINAFAMRTTQGQKPIVPKTVPLEPGPRISSTGLESANSAVAADESVANIRSKTLPDQPDRSEKSKSGFGGLKRLGTVIGRRKSTHPYSQALANDGKKSTSNVSTSGFSPFKKKSKDKHQTMDFSTQPIDAAPLSNTLAGTASRLPDIASSELREDGVESATVANAVTPTVERSDTDVDLANRGSEVTSNAVQSSLVTSTGPNRAPQISGLENGTALTSLSESIAAITLAEQEAATTPDGSQAQFKVDIRKAPIEEEDGEASAAMASVTSALRAQAAPRRSQGTLRGRRDRNTILLANPPNFAIDPQAPEPVATLQSMTPLSASTDAVQSPNQAPSTPDTQQAPLKLLHRSALGADDIHGSDTHSIRSGRSLASSASSTIRHPELSKPGLNASIVETISAWFEDETISRAAVIGEVALAYNPPDISLPFSMQTIRLDNFPLLDKVAPNPAFLEPIDNRPGSYLLNARDVTKTSVGFKYQLRLDESVTSSYTPLLVKSNWKFEEAQASVLLTYGMHPAFAANHKITDAIILNNVVLIVHLDASVAKAKSCRAMGGGMFSLERNLVYWRYDELRLSPTGSAETLKARFFTDTMGKAGNIEARWEISDKDLGVLPSGLSVSMMENAATHRGDSADPFADDQPEPLSVARWSEAHTQRRCRSGIYVSLP